MDKPQTFRSPTALVVWVVWLLFAVANWIDLAVQARDHTSAIAAALLLLATGVAYVTAQRPRIIADDTAVTIRNPLRDYRVGWARIAKVDLVDLLRVHCDGGTPGGRKPKVISAWAVHYSRRRQFTAEARARRAASPRRASLGFPSAARGLSGDRSPSYAATHETPTAEAEAKKVVRLLSERVTAARAEALWSVSAPDTTDTRPVPATQATAIPQTTAETETLTSTWSAPAIAALVIPALIVLIVWLL